MSSQVTHEFADTEFIAHVKLRKHLAPRWIGKGQKNSFEDIFPHVASTINMQEGAYARLDIDQAAEPMLSATVWLAIRR